MWSFYLEVAKQAFERLLMLVVVLPMGKVSNMSSAFNVRCPSYFIFYSITVTKRVPNDLIVKYRFSKPMI